MIFSTQIRSTLLARFSLQNARHTIQNTENTVIFLHPQHIYYSLELREGFLVPSAAAMSICRTPREHNREHAEEEDRGRGTTDDRHRRTRVSERHTRQAVTQRDSRRSVIHFLDVFRVQCQTSFDTNFSMALWPIALSTAVSVKVSLIFSTQIR